jgi:hypothetical protein
MADYGRYEGLLEDTESRCTQDNFGTDESNPWVACMGPNAVLWPDADAQRNHDDLRESGAKVGVGVESWTFSDTRRYCLVMGRTACRERLKHNVAVLRRDYKTMDRVWDAEDKKRHAEAKRSNEDDCRKRFPQ